MVSAVLSAPTLTPELLNGNQQYRVPENLYNETVTPLLKQMKASGVSDPSSVQFDPKVHIRFTDDYYQKTKRLTLEELGIEPHQDPISDVGVSEPFPLFTDQAIAIMRWELFQQDNFMKCGRVQDHSTTGDLDIAVRGYARKGARFTYEAWSHPKTLEIISGMAGVELVNQMDYEIAHSNISIRQKSTTVLNKGLDDYEDPNDIPAIVSWHYDSPQFVCVLMMSDTEQMVGGETSLLMGNGKVASVANPRKGWANVLQGRIVRHVAPKPRGLYTERITAVGSYRPKDPLADGCVLTTTKPSRCSGSRYNDYYKDWMNYRMDVLKQRIDVLQNKINKDIDSGNLFDQLATIEFLQKKVVEYVEHTWQEFEVVDDGLVEKPASYKVVQARWD